jgi:hypothetical protein
MEWLPTARAVVEKVVLPVASSVPLPRFVPASAKLTVPVGIAEPEAAVTAAEKVTLLPLTAVVAEAVRVVVVPMPGAAGATVTVTVDETLPRKVVDPP